MTDETTGQDQQGQADDGTFTVGDMESLANALEAMSRTDTPHGRLLRQIERVHNEACRTAAAAN